MVVQRTTVIECFFPFLSIACGLLPRRLILSALSFQAALLPGARRNRDQEATTTLRYRSHDWILICDLRTVNYCHFSGFIECNRYVHCAFSSNWLMHRKAQHTNPERNEFSCFCSFLCAQRKTSYTEMKFTINSIQLAGHDHVIMHAPWHKVAEMRTTKMREKQ